MHLTSIRERPKKKKKIEIWNLFLINLNISRHKNPQILYVPPIRSIRITLIAPDNNRTINSLIRLEGTESRTKKESLLYRRKKILLYTTWCSFTSDKLIDVVLLLSTTTFMTTYEFINGLDIWFEFKRVYSNTILITFQNIIDDCRVSHELHK